MSRLAVALRALIAPDRRVATPSRRGASRPSSLLSRWALPALAIMMTATFALVVTIGVAVRDHSDQAAQETLTYVATITQDRVARFVESGDETVDHLAIGYRRGLLGEDITEIQASLHGVLVNQPEVRGVMLALPDGSFAIIRRDGEGFAGRYIDMSDGRHEVSSTWNSDFDVVSRFEDPSALSPFDLDWYQAAMAAQGHVWTDPVVRAVTETIGVRVADVVRDDQGEIVAVVAADLLLSDLGRVINEIPEKAGAEAFLLGEGRTVIAAPESYNAALAAMVDDTGAPVRAASLGLSSDAMVRPHSPLDGFAQIDDGRVALERGLEDAAGVPWVIHLVGTKQGLSPALSLIDRELTLVMALLIAALVAFLGVIARLWRPVAETRDRALSDALTGLSNRADFERRGPRILAKAHRGGGRLVLAMIDLDGFKSLNDVLGHDAGDRALVTVARILSARTRADDLMVRWGGDEFLAVMAVGRGDDPAEVVERLRQDVVACLAGAQGEVACLGATAGAAVSTSPTDVLATLVAIADAELVQGKRTAKGRTYMSGPLVASSP